MQNPVGGPAVSILHSPTVVRNHPSSENRNKMAQIQPFNHPTIQPVAEPAEALTI